MNDTPRPRKRRRTLGTLMEAVAALAVVFSVTRPLWTPASYRAATRVLREVGPRPGVPINPNHYRADSAIQTPSGFWKVHFTRVAGSGAPDQNVMVPDDVVKRARFLPW